MGTQFLAMIFELETFRLRMADFIGLFDLGCIACVAEVGDRDEVWELWDDCDCEGESVDDMISDSQREGMNMREEEVSCRIY